MDSVKYAELQKRFEKVVSDFDFMKVKTAMQDINWIWITSAGAKIPSVDEMKNCVWDLFEDVIKLNDEEGDDLITVSSGGFEIIIGNDMQDISLRFLLEESYLESHLDSNEEVQDESY